MGRGEVYPRQLRRRPFKRVVGATSRDGKLKVKRGPPVVPFCNVGDTILHQEISDAIRQTCAGHCEWRRVLVIDRSVLVPEGACPVLGRIISSAQILLEKLRYLTR